VGVRYFNLFPPVHIFVLFPIAISVTRKFGVVRESRLLTGGISVMATSLRRESPVQYVQHLQFRGSPFYRLVIGLVREICGYQCNL
jgi:hypothetical protein